MVTVTHRDDAMKHKQTNKTDEARRVERFWNPEKDHS